MKLKHNNINQLFTFLIFFFSFLLIVSYRKEKGSYFSSGNSISRDTLTGNKIADTNKITYLALGNSCTTGASVLEQERFPVQLSGMLHNDVISILAPDIIATSG